MALHVGVFQTKAGAIEFIAGHMLQVFSSEVRSCSKRPVILPTGSTFEGDEGVYARFASIALETGLDLTDYPIFNMDAYLQNAGPRKLSLLAPDDPIGYQFYMKSQLFDRLGITPTYHRFPTPPLGQQHRTGTPCKRYSEELSILGNAVVAYGGIGGAVPHVAFNGAGSKLTAVARIVRLSEEEREKNAEIYGLRLEQVPMYAATVGMRELMRASFVLLAAFGEGKAEVVKQCVEDPTSIACPAGLLLQSHKNAILVLDEKSASELDCQTEVERIAA